jgi:hypothetical protein
MEDAVATLVGGGLAVAGGVLSTIILHLSTRRESSRTIVRTKLEEAYQAVNETEKWFQHEMRQMASLGGTKGEQTNPSEKVVMLVSLYEPSLASEAMSFKESVDLFQSAAFKYWAETIKNEGKLSADRFRELIEQPFEDGRLQCRSLQSSIQAAFQKHIR